MIKIEDNFTFKNGDIIVVGCSTGPDSMALVDMLLKIRKKYDLKLIIAHVNHNIRKESYQEAEFLKDYCLKNDLLFETMIIENYGDDNFHNEARNIRYSFFENIVNKYNADYLMTAHHGDDLMETILMRMVRGSNLAGYSGFKKEVIMNNYKIIRPLLNYTKQELEDYDKENNVMFFVDSSNSKDDYTRNRYRKYVLPFLKEEDNNVHLKFLKFSNTLNEANRFIEKTTNNAIKKVMDNDSIIIDKFLELDSYIQKEVLYYILQKYYQDDLVLLNDKHISLILDIINSNKPNTYVNLPNDVIAKKEYNMFYLTREIDIISLYEIEFDKYVELPNNHKIEAIDYCESNGNDICRLSSKDIVLPLIVRTRRVGDKISVKGLNGSKKVKDLFIDKKISIDKRDSWPIVVDSRGKIVWVPGIIKSKFDKKINDNYDIILKYR